MKQWKPWFFENSRFPVWLSKVVPIDVWAVNIGPFVWCKGTLSDRDKRHETIHYQQQLELLFIGQWLLYFLFYVVNYVRYRDGLLAYIHNPFEIEAYSSENDEGYLITRPRWNWVKWNTR